MPAQSLKPPENLAARYLRMQCWGLSSPLAQPQTSPCLILSRQGETSPTRVRTGGSSAMSPSVGPHKALSPVLALGRPCYHAAPSIPTTSRCGSVWVSTSHRAQPGSVPQPWMGQYPLLTFSRGPQRPRRSLTAPGLLRTYITMGCQEQPWLYLGHWVPIPQCQPRTLATCCSRLGMTQCHSTCLRHAGSCFKPAPPQTKGVPHQLSHNSSRALPTS